MKKSVQWRLSGQANKACSLPMQTKFWFYRLILFFADMCVQIQHKFCHINTIKKFKKLLSRSASGPKHKQTLTLIDISKKKIDLTLISINIFNHLFCWKKINSQITSTACSSLNNKPFCVRDSTEKVSIVTVYIILWEFLCFVFFTPYRLSFKK